jgi:LPS sulfotransferase NodH
LCECLESTCIAGRPAEVFAPDFRHLWREFLDVAPAAGFDEYLCAVRSHGTTANGVYALKLQWMHMSTLASEAAFRGDADDVLEWLFPGSLFVNIRRRDRRAQALSLYRAYATNEWWRFRGDLRIRKRPPLHRPSVLKLEEEIERQQSSWERWFRGRGITPLTVEYEALAATSEWKPSECCSSWASTPLPRHPCQNRG